MQVVIVTGDRNATKYPAFATRWALVIRSTLNAVLDDALTAAEPALLIHGACGLYAGAPGNGALKGIDALADQIGRELGFIVATFPADWMAQGIAAGPRRNELMIRYARRLANDGGRGGGLAVHGEFAMSKGTRGTVELARRYGLPATRFRSDGGWLEVAA